MSAIILLLVCLQLLSSQTINEPDKLYAELSESALHSTGRSESGSQFSVGWSSSSHTGNTAESQSSVEWSSSTHMGNRAQSQSSVGQSSSRHMGNTAESETKETSENLNKYPNALTIMYKAELPEHDVMTSSSINPKNVAMVTGKKTHLRISEPFISTTALATTVPDLTIPTSVLAKPGGSDTASTVTPAVSMATDQIQESISDPVAKETSMGNSCLYLDNITK